MQPIAVYVLANTAQSGQGSTSGGLGRDDTYGSSRQTGGAQDDSYGSSGRTGGGLGADDTVSNPKSWTGVLPKQQDDRKLDAEGAITDWISSMARPTRLEVLSREASEVMSIAAVVISVLVAVSELMIL